MPKAHAKRRSAGRGAEIPAEGAGQTFLERARQALFGVQAPSEETLAALVAESATLTAQDAHAVMSALAREGQDRSLDFLSAAAAVHASPVAVAAVEALGLVRVPAAAVALLALAASGTDRESQKEARRSLFRLRAAGVSIPEAPTAPEAPVPERVLLSRASTVDGAGTRLVVLASETSLGAATFVAVVLNDERGILDVLGARVARGEVERRLATIVANSPGVRLADVPPDYARQAIAAGHEVNRAAAVPVPPEYYHWREAIGVPLARPEREPVYEEIDPAAVRWNPQLLEQSGNLLHLPEFASWVLPENDVEQAVRDLSRVRESRLVLPGRNQEDPQLRTLERFVEGYFTESVRQRYRRRLEQTAYVLARAGRAMDARLAVATALALDPASGTPVARQPFPLALAGRTLELMGREQRAKRERAGGLVLPP